MSSNRISDAFNVMPTKQLKIVSVEEPVKKTAAEDAEFSRNNLKDLLKTGSIALENALNVAVSSESPRAYEVLSGLINTIADLNTKLLATHQVEQRIEQGNVSNQTGVVNNTQNIVFNGSTKDLAESLSKLKIIKSE